ncbi:hypothetical protein AURANDRAFT_72719 [Aureococcus anophagefferens]|uniref:Uncharacterized protein n=1 Tax=Aureococcus anophagefferens TaxID=44056 RepID=F0YN85_AURAN|nr:hypothetical protein AURANDRAFT_72719 [Aureococcus anophagefferens]EGB03402.1 hypothetical protein AURANDRAFT_72719 [Aureococcus anophagefferens]|eukprot:XP_009041873.1 hypothetical protein AURANDRAFT_72719 [Aureococcus anophagefferens]
MRGSVERAIRILDCAPLRYGQRLRIVFQALESDNSGFVEISQLCGNSLLCNRIGACLNSIGAYTFFNQFDADVSGRLYFHEFVICLARQAQHAHVIGASDHLFLNAWTCALRPSNKGVRRGRDLKHALISDPLSPLFVFIPSLGAVLAPERTFGFFSDFLRDAKAAICFELAAAIKMSCDAKLVDIIPSVNEYRQESKKGQHKSGLPPCHSESSLQDVHSLVSVSLGRLGSNLCQWGHLARGNLASLHSVKSLFEPREVKFKNVYATGYSAVNSSMYLDRLDLRLCTDLHDEHSGACCRPWLRAHLGLKKIKQCFENDRRNSEVQHLESEVIKDSYAALKDGHGLAVQRLRAELAAITLQKTRILTQKRARDAECAVLALKVDHLMALKSISPEEIFCDTAPHRGRSQFDVLVCTSVKINLLRDRLSSALREIARLRSITYRNEAELQSLRGVQVESAQILQASRGTTEALSAAMIREVVAAARLQNIKRQNTSLQLEATKAEMLETDLHHVRKVLQKTETDCCTIVGDSREMPLVQKSHPRAPDRDASSCYLAHKVGWLIKSQRNLHRRLAGLVFDRELIPLLHAEISALKGRLYAMSRKLILYRLKILTEQLAMQTKRAHIATFGLAASSHDKQDALANSRSCKLYWPLPNRTENTIVIVILVAAEAILAAVDFRARCLFHPCSSVPLCKVKRLLFLAPGAVARVGGGFH